MPKRSEPKWSITKLIRDYRNSLGLTQVEFAKKYGMKSIILVSLWESGKREAPFTVVNDVINWYIPTLLAHSQEQAREEGIGIGIDLCSKSLTLGILNKTGFEKMIKELSKLKGTK